MKKILAGFIALALVGPCSAHQPVPPAAIHVPFELQHGLPTIQATVGGKSVSLILDLGGGSMLALTTASLQKVTVNFTGKTHQFSDSAGNITRTRDYIAPHFVSGGLVLDQLAGNELSGRKSFPWDGYLGIGVLKRYLLVFDYPQHELRLYPSGARAVMRKECGDASIPIELVKGVVQSTVATDHGTLTFAWDTGSSLDIVRPAAVGKAYKPSSDGSLQTITFKRFSMNSRNYEPVEMALMPFTAPAVDGFIGSPFMHTRVVCIDPGAGVAAIR